MDVRCSDSKGAVEHTCCKNKPITGPSGLILPVFPHKGVARIAFASPARHDGADQNRDRHSSQYEEEADLGNGRQRAVHVHDDEGRHPGECEIYDENLPPLVCVAIVEETIHGYDLVGEDGGNGRGAKEPAQEVPPVVLSLASSFCKTNEACSR
jgi:hypothetical protein